MEYQEVQHLGRQDANAAEMAGDERAWVDAMLGIARYEPDREWAEKYFIDHMGEGSSFAVRWGAIQSLAELVRNGGLIDQATVLKNLRELLNDLKLGGVAQDTIDDITMYSGGGVV